MSPDPLTVPPTRERLFQLGAAGQLAPEALERALVLTESIPDDKAWKQFSTRLLLLLGAAFLVVGLLFFLAYNWSELGRFAKMGLAEAAIGVALALVGYKGLDSLVGKVALLAAGVLVGAFLVVFGQAYSSAADTYQLFLLWTLLILPWALLARMQALWLLWMVLVNSVYLSYWGEVLPSAYWEKSFMYLGLFALNGIALMLWEFGRYRSIPWLRGRWLPQLLLLAVLASLIIPTQILIFNGDHRIDGDPLLMAMPVFFTAVVMFCLWFYHKNVFDLFILAACLLAVIWVVTSALIRLFDADTDVLLVIGLLVVAQSALAVRWLRKVAATAEGSA